MKNESSFIKNGVIQIGKKYFGRCAICKKQTELTKEHIPPRSAFNKNTVKVTSGFDMIKKEGYPIVNENLRGRIVQGGYSVYSLCRSCNNLTGQYYGNAYREFISGIHQDLCLKTIMVNSKVSVCVKIKPLNIFKQIVSMFCSVNPGVFKNIDIEKFLLNKMQKNFPSKLYFYIFVTQDGAVIPVQAQHRNVGGEGCLYILSEISHYPLGIIMSDKELKNEICCINHFLNFDYDEEVEMKLEMFYRERNVMIVQDYRTKDELRKAIEGNED